MPEIGDSTGAEVGCRIQNGELCIIGFSEIIIALFETLIDNESG